MLKLLIKALVVAAVLIAANSVRADEQSTNQKTLESLPPMDTATRKAFDKALKSVYRAKCDCYTFLLDGKLYRIARPLNDMDRRLLIDGFKHGFLVPLSNDGQQS